MALSTEDQIVEAATNVRDAVLEDLAGFVLGVVAIWWKLRGELNA